MEPTSEIVKINNNNDTTEFCIHTWNHCKDTKQSPKGLIIIYHGFLAHGLYPTVRYAAELFSNTNQYIVIAPDLRGHGSSTKIGLPGYLPSRDVIIQDCINITKYAIQLYNNNKQKLKCFLVGSSMGGTIALSVAQEMMKNNNDDNIDTKIDGVVLLAPMLQLSVSTPERILLKCLSYIIPTLQIIPSSSTNSEKQYRDPNKRKECENDEKIIKGSNIRIGSASTCVELAKCIQNEFKNITIPFLVMVADEDIIVNNQGDIDLYEQSPSIDKTIKHYPALHGLLCEPKPLLDQIHNDLLDWVNKRL